MFLSKIKSFFSGSKLVGEPKLIRRLFNSEFQELGCVRRKSDSRTVEQLKENIDYYARIYPEVAEFRQELKYMNPKFLGLVSDICELAGNHEFVNTGIDINNPSYNGKSLFRFLMEQIPPVSKGNPESLELCQAIIDNTDSIASKYTLGMIVPLFNRKEMAQHMKATVPLVGEIAQVTLQGPYRMDYSREQSFVNALYSFISPNVIIEKLRMLPQILKVADKAKSMCEIDAIPFLTNETPVKKIEQNLETFQKLDANMEGRTINLTDFLDNNVNMI